MPDRRIDSTPSAGRRTVGQPSKLTTAVKDAIVRAVKMGANRQAAARAAGISKSSLSYWLTLGRQGYDALHTGFLEAVEQAEAECQIRNVLFIQSAAQGGAVVERKTHTDKNGAVTVTERVAQPQWTAAAWYLERKYPHLYGQNRQEIRVLEAKLAEALQRLEQLTGINYASQPGGPVRRDGSGGATGSAGADVSPPAPPGPPAAGGGSAQLDW